MRESIGPYKIIEKIGLGGMGIVYKAVHEKIDQTVAIKAIPPYSSEDGYIRKKFLNEAKLQAKLSHPHIVNIFNYIESDESIFLVMEYINGETLEERIKRVGCIPHEEALHISEKILDALQYLHERGIVHRDIKPSNIMFTDNGTVKVTDFGISKLVDQKGITTTILAGSYTYISPEEITGEGTTYYSDIYSYGITLYHMLCGQPPFAYDTEYRIMKAHLEEKPKDLRTHNNKIPGSLSKAVLRAISKDPAQRYKTPSEFKSSLVKSAVSDKFSLDFYFIRSLVDKNLPGAKQFGNKYLRVAMILLVMFTSFIITSYVQNNSSFVTEKNLSQEIPKNNVLDEIVLMDLARVINENSGEVRKDVRNRDVKRSENSQTSDFNNSSWKIRK